MSSVRIRGDLSGALAASATVIPISLVTGMIAFAPLGAEYVPQGIVAGLYAAIIPSLILFLSGSYSAVTVAPLASAALVFAATAGQLVEDPGLSERPDLVIGLCFVTVILAGLFQVLFGLFRLGGAIKFVSYPVIAGIMNGAALSLAWSGAGSLLVSPAGAESGVSGFPVIAAAIALATALLWHQGGRLVPSIPGPLLGLAGGLLLHHALGLAGIDAGGSMNDVPMRLPVVPELQSTLEWSWAYLPLIASAAFTIALLCSVQTLLALLTTQNLTAERLDTNRELVLHGIRNLGNALIGAVAASGATSRAIIFHEAGGRSRLGGLLTPLLTLGIILGLSQFIDLLPRSVAAGLALMAAALIVDRWSLRLFRYALTPAIANRGEYLWNLGIMVLVALTVVAFDILAAVVLGVVMSIFAFIRQMNRAVVRSVLDGARIRSRKVRQPAALEILREHGSRIAIVELQGPLFFVSTDALVQQVDRLVADGVRHIVIDLKRTTDTDITGANVLRQLHGQMGDKGVSIVFSYLHRGSKLWTFLDDLGFDTESGRSPCHADTDQALELCEDRLLEELDTHDEAHVSRSLDTLLGIEGLLPEHGQMLNDAAEARTFAADQFLCRLGDPGDSMFVIDTGEAEITIPLPGHDRRKRLATLGPGALFGEMSLLDGGSRSADVRAIRPLTCYVFTRSAFEQLRHQHPEVALVLMDRIARIMVARLRVANETIGELER